MRTDKQTRVWSARTSILLGAVFLLFSGSSLDASEITATRDLPERRAFHGSTVLGDFLYVMGGRRGPLDNENHEVDTTSVLMAPIGQDGQLGEWRQTTPLPGPRYYISSSTVAMNDVVYIVGGSTSVDGGQPLNTAIWSRPLPNGMLTAWQESPPFGEGLSAPAAITTPGHLHVIGGQLHSSTRGEVSPAVWSNRIYADGSLGNWERGPELPVPLYHHQAGVVSGRVYVWGGLARPESEQIEPSIYVLSAPILGSGRLGNWRLEQTRLPAQIYSGPSAVAGNFLISFVPRTRGGYIDDRVFFSQVLPGNNMTRWGERPATIPNRIFHAVAPDYRRGTIYITGGRGPTWIEPMISGVSFFTLSQSARQQAEEAWLASQRAHTDSVSAAAAPAEGAALTYVVDARVAEEAVPGFLAINDARTRSLREGVPLILHFTMDAAPPCREQNELLRTPEFRRLSEVAAFAWIETADYPQLVQQLGVYRVPSWIFYDLNGEEQRRHAGVLRASEVAQILIQLRGNSSK